MPHPDAPAGAGRSIDALSLAQWIAVAAGSAVAAYLVYVHYQETALVCGVGDCEKVQTSSYAEFLGIPIAWFGLALYLAMAGLLVARQRGLLAVDITDVLMVGATFAGTLAVAYLTYLEVWVIDAICQWCVTFAVITVVLLVLSALQLVRSFATDHSTT
jgi:uncharacterized membrane protein